MKSEKFISSVHAAGNCYLIGKDVMTVLNVTSFGGMWNTLVPALLVLSAYILVFGSFAVFTIKRGTGSEVK